MMRSIITRLILIAGGIFFLTQLESCKHDSLLPNNLDTPAGIPNTPLTSDGPTLYANICASCHGPLASSTKRGASATLIQTGISTVNNMKSLTYLTLLQIEAIAAALHDSIPAPTPTTLDGTILYNTICASCHGPLASSTKLGATASLISTGISTISQMQSLSNLSSAQIQAIAGILQSTTPNPTPSTDGVTLYASYCASCHGPLASSAKIGASASRIQTAISTVSNMSSLSSLSGTQVQAISTALMAQSMPTDGPTLYAINCSSCHGALANSSAGGASVSEIQSAIREKRKMQYLSTLTLAQIQAISGALAGIAGGDH